ncbi:MAG: hypothetical protein V3U09_06630 [Thermoplasmata archaeon]
MDAQKLRTALNGTVVTSDAYSRSNLQIGSKSGKWDRLLRFNK